MVKTHKDFTPRNKYAPTYADYAPTYADYAPTYADYAQFLSGADERKIAHNTYVSRVGEVGSIAIIYHYTPIVTLHENGDIELRTGGWQSVTTKQRINQFSPVQVYQENYEWYLADGTPYEEGMVIQTEPTIDSQQTLRFAEYLPVESDDFYIYLLLDELSPNDYVVIKEQCDHEQYWQGYGSHDGRTDDTLLAVIPLSALDDEGYISASDIINLYTE